MNKVLRRAENVEAYQQRDFAGMIMGGKYRMHLRVGKKSFIVSPRITIQHAQGMRDRSAETPVPYGQVGDRAYWLFAGRWFWDNDGLSQQDVHALLVTREMRKNETINRARTVASMTASPVPTPRRGIPDDVKQLVWHRDGGRCRKCGVNTELQYDHVIPVAMGGGSTEDNLQVLCGPCNRRKGASVV